MDVLTNPLFIAVLSALGGVIGLLGAQALSKLDFTSIRSAATRSDLAAVEARVVNLEEDRSKIADALERLARMEERHAANSPRLDRADATADAMIALAEQMRTAFRRLDAFSAQLEDLPRQTARELRSLIRPASSHA